MKKICGLCEKEFEPIDMDHPYQRYCSKRCRQRAYRKRYPDMLAARNRRFYEKQKKYLQSVLAERGCVVCGIRDIRVLVFHHRNPQEKKFKIGGVGRTHGRKSLDKEIAKCDVLCANHHLLVHWEENNAIYEG